MYKYLTPYPKHNVSSHLALWCIALEGGQSIESANSIPSMTLSKQPYILAAEEGVVSQSNVTCTPSTNGNVIPTLLVPMVLFVKQAPGP